MKKLLVVLLALAMVFGLATSAIAAEYSDVTELDVDTQDAIYRLSALDVLAGYPDGGFQPNANITRAEFAKIAVLISNLGEAADSVKNSVSQYSDVPAGVWYTGYVNMASAQGFFKGYADGTFKPNANINMSEVITVLLRIAGYDDNLVGSWPFDYIAMASKRGITDDVTFVSGAAATRAQVAVMTDATIDEEMVYWDADKASYQGLYKVAGAANTNLYVGNFEAIFAHNFTNGIVRTTITDWEVKDFDAMTIGILHGGAGSGKALADSFYISGGYKFYELNGLQADVYYDKAATNSSAKVVYIDVNASSKFSDDVDVNWTGAVLNYVNVDGKRVSLATNAAGVAITTFNDDLGNVNQTEVKAKLFFNDDEELYRVEYVDVDNSPAPAPSILTAGTDAAADAATLTIVEAYDASAKRIDAVYGSGFSVKDKDVVVIKDGKIATLADIKAGDFFYRDRNQNSADETIVIESGLATGKLSVASATKLTLGDKKYLWAAGYTDMTDSLTDDTAFGPLTLAGLDNAYGEEVKFITAPSNPYAVILVNFDKAATTTVYGIVTDATGNIGAAINSLTILNQDGKEVVYPIVKSSDFRKPVWGADVNEGSYIEAKVSADGSIETKNIKMIAQYNVGVTHGDWDTTTTVTLDTVAPITNFSTYLNEAGTVAVTRKDARLKLNDGQYYTVTDKTVAFEVESDALFAYKDASVITVDSLKKMNDLLAADSVYVARVSEGILKAIVFIESNITSTDSFGIATDSWYSGDYMLQIDGSKTYEISGAYTGIIDKSVVRYNVNSENEATYAVALDSSLLTGWTKGAATAGVVGVPAPAGSLSANALGATVANQWVVATGALAGVNAAGALVDVISRDGNTLTLGTGNAIYYLTDDARYFYISTSAASIGEITETSMSAVRASCDIFALTTNKPADMKIQYVFIVDEN